MRMRYSLINLRKLMIQNKLPLIRAQDLVILFLQPDLKIPPAEFFRLFANLGRPTQNDTKNAPSGSVFII